MPQVHGTSNWNRFLLRLGNNDPTLTILDLSYGQIEDVGPLSLALKNNNNLTHLNLMSNEIGDAGAKDLSFALEHNHNLVSLNLCGNKIGDVGAKYLSIALRKNCTLQYLGLRKNQIEDVGAKNLIDAFAENHALTCLDLRQNHFSSSLDIPSNPGPNPNLHLGNPENEQIDESSAKKMDIFIENKFRLQNPSGLIEETNQRRTILLRTNEIDLSSLTVNQKRSKQSEDLTQQMQTQKLPTSTSNNESKTPKDLTQSPAMPNLTHSSNSTTTAAAPNINKIEQSRPSNSITASPSIRKSARFDFSEETQAIKFAEQGEMQYDRMDYNGAIKSLTIAIELNPKYALAYCNRANTKAELGQFREALKDYAKAIHLDPKNPLIYSDQAKAKNALDLRQEALNDYTKTIELYLKNIETYLRQARTKSTSSQQGSTKEHTSLTEFNSKCAVAYRDRGKLKAELKQYHEAISDFTKAIELDSKDVQAYTHRGQVKDKLGQPHEAQKDFLKAKELDPRDAIDYRREGFKKYLSGKFHKPMYKQDRVQWFLYNRLWLLDTSLAQPWRCLDRNNPTQ